MNLTACRNLFWLKKKVVAQIWMIMKLTTIFMLAVCLHANAKGYSQKLTISHQNVALEKVFKEISKQTGYTFIYTEKLLQKGKKVSISTKDASIEQVLKECFKDQFLTYSIVDKYIIIKEKEEEIYKEKVFSSLPPPPPIDISGKVTNDKGEPLGGATITEKGTNNVAATKDDGSFTINVLKANTKLLVSYVGYEAKELSVSNQTDITISLVQTTSNLNDVVVVGYGKQKKVNLTGAVSTISGDDLLVRPVGQTSAALQGMAPGVTITQRSGRPGGDAGTIRIRGIGTLNNSDPLVLIDGIEGSMNNIDPNIIESVSILKDAASASIYGSRAANGVVLITTKRANKKVGINFSSYIGWQRPTNMPNIVNALDHMILMNEAFSNVGRTPLYSNDLIEQYRGQKNVNSDKYPNTNWQKEVLTGSGLQQSHFLTVNGGSEKVRLLTSVGYFDQNGIIENSGFKRYTIRNNADITFSKQFSVKFDLQFINTITTEPGRGTGTIFNFMNAIPANQSGINSNGTWGVGWNGTNPIAASRVGGTNRTNDPLASLNASINFHPTEWLAAEITVAPKFTESISKRFNKAIQTYLPDGTPSFVAPAITTLTESNSRSFYNNLRALLTFDKTFGIHNLKALVGTSQEDYRNDNLSAYRETYILPDYPVIDAGSAVNQQTSGSAEEWALRSYFGRLNYDYKQKYLFELNGRYDGSSRFAEGNNFISKVASHLAGASFLNSRFSWATGGCN